MTAGRHVNPLSQSWCTPHKYVNAIKRFWNGKIDLDPCSNEYSVVEAEVEYRLPMHDGLKESWNYPTVYVNPPYGADREPYQEFFQSSTSEPYGRTGVHHLLATEMPRAVVCG